MIWLDEEREGGFWKNGGLSLYFPFILVL